MAINFDEENCVQVQQLMIYNTKCEKLLGIKIGHKLSFEEHTSTLYRKASQKLRILPRIAQFMNAKQRRIIMKAFINYQFGYCQ